MTLLCKKCHFLKKVTRLIDAGLHTVQCIKTYNVTERENFKEIICKVRSEEILRSMWLNIFAFPHIRRGLSSNKTLHPIASNSLHCNENYIYVFLFWKLRGLNPNFHIHMSVRNLYIPKIGPHISCRRMGRSIVGIYKSLTDTWMWKLGRGRAIPFLGIFVSNFRHWFFEV